MGCRLGPGELRRRWVPLNRPAGLPWCTAAAQTNRDELVRGVADDLGDCVKGSQGAVRLVEQGKRAERRGRVEVVLVALDEDQG